MTEVDEASSRTSAATVAGIAISVEPDPTPYVAAVARDLADCLREDAAFADATRDLNGTVAVASESTPQAATLSVAGATVAIAHGAGEDVDVSTALELSGPPDPPRGIRGAAQHPELAEWASRLLRPPLPGWAEAAERFWEELSAMPGAPAALVVVESESGERQRFGSPDGPAHEIHGAADGLVSVLTGRVPVLDASFEGAVRLRCSFAAISVLSGAGFRIRFGRPGSDPLAGRDRGSGGEKGTG